MPCAVVMKSGNLNFLEPSGPLQALNGTDLPLPTTGQLVKVRRMNVERVKDKQWATPHVKETLGHWGHASITRGIWKETALAMGKQKKGKLHMCCHSGADPRREKDSKTAGCVCASGHSTVYWCRSSNMFVRKRLIVVVISLVRAFNPSNMNSSTCTTLHNHVYSLHKTCFPLNVLAT